MKPIEFGDYALLKKIAAGGMGEVFLARQDRGAGFERYVAIKRILPDLSDDDEFVRMFLDEARLASRLSHPNVVQIYDLGICGDQYYLAMEFLEGRDLRRIMGRLATHNRALPGAHAIQIIYGAAEGLHYAHNLKDDYSKPLNIIHRDVSPQNIFVSFHGTVKVLDFGIAKAEARSVRTRTGGLKGKYPYLSPEQVRGEEVDNRSDIFSLGTVLWEVTVGRRLFKRENDLLTLQAVLRCDVPPPSELMNKYPSELEDIVMRALTRHPADRYSSCRELQEDLEQFMGQYGLVLSPQKLGDSVRRTFSDEPCTVQEILDQLKEKPRSMSLLGEDESSDSSSHSEPVLRPRERTDPSGPSQQVLLDLARSAAEEDSDPSRPMTPGSFNAVSRVCLPELDFSDHDLDLSTDAVNDDVLPSVHPVASDWDVARPDPSLEFSTSELPDEVDPRVCSNLDRSRVALVTADAPDSSIQEVESQRDSYLPPPPPLMLDSPYSASGSEPMISVAQPDDPEVEHGLNPRSSLTGSPADTIDEGLRADLSLEPPTLEIMVPDKADEPGEVEQDLPQSENAQEAIVAAKAFGSAWSNESSFSNTQSALLVISRVPTVIRNVREVVPQIADESHIDVPPLLDDDDDDDDDERDERASTLVTKPPTSRRPRTPLPQVPPLDFEEFPRASSAPPSSDSEPPPSSDSAPPPSSDSAPPPSSDSAPPPSPSSAPPPPDSEPPPSFVALSSFQLPLPPIAPQPEPIALPFPERGSSPSTFDQPTTRSFESSLSISLPRESTDSVLLPPSGLEVLWNWFRKRPMLVPVVLLLAFVLPFGITVAVVSVNRGWGNEANEELDPSGSEVSPIDSGQDLAPVGDVGLPEVPATIGGSENLEVGASQESSDLGLPGSDTAGEENPPYDNDPSFEVGLPEKASSKRDRRSPIKLAQQITFSIETIPENLQVRIEGKSHGTSPIRVSLESGTYRVNLRSSPLGIDFTTPLRVESGDERQRIQVPRGSLALKIVPYADVYVDGSRRGLTPMPAIDLYAGRHSVRLVNDRLGRSVVRTVTVRPNSRSMLEVDMTSDL